MATVKVKFRPSSVCGREGIIYYQIFHNKVTRQVTTEYKVYAWEWDEKHHCIVTSTDTERMNRLQSLREKIQGDKERFGRIIAAFMRKDICFSAEDIIEEFQYLVSRLSFFNFMERLICRFRQDGKIRTSETYRSARNSFFRFRKGNDIMLDSFSQEIIESYESYLQSRGLIPNSISFHMRILRAVYNRACEQGLTCVSSNPFAHVYTGVDKTAKRAVSIDTIRQIRNLVTADKATDYARDIFMLSFYLRGMSFIDLAYLKKTDFANGMVTYRRRKTGQILTIRWTKEMQSIVDKYPENETEYLFPIITSRRANSRYQYRNKHYKVNYNLKNVAQEIGLQIPLTTYVARHSWASIAKSKGIAVSVISEGLGHDNEQTTQIYLSTLDTSAVDRANDIILSSL